MLKVGGSGRPCEERRTSVEIRSHDKGESKSKYAEDENTTMRKEQSKGDDDKRVPGVQRVSTRLDKALEFNGR